MSTRIKFLSIFILFTLLILSGCQNEVVEIIDPPNDQVITPNSAVADLVQRTSLKDGSHDNIIDQASCISLVLPVTVIANGLEITIDSEDDFKLLEQILDRLEEKEDILELIFPVNVILADHSKITIDNEDDFKALRDECKEGGDDDDIECVDFKYPITLSIYDAENQLSDVITVNNDEELHDFFDDLDDNKYCSFNFPITIVLSGGDEIVINNNDELEDIIKNAINDCDEDDDNDYNDDDVDDSKLIAILIDGKWEITYFFDNSDITEVFAGYIFTFKENGRVLATDGITTVEGKWSSNGDDGILELELDFGSERPFHEIQDGWYVLKFEESIIKLKDESSTNNSIKYLTFERPTDDPGGDKPSISKVIVEGLWVVAKYVESDLNKTENYKGFKLDFNSEGWVLASNGEDKIEGTWLEINHNGIDYFALDFGNVVPFDEFNEDWEIVDVTETRIELKNVSGGDGLTEHLVLERLDDNTGGNTIPSLSAVLIEGKWIVANYLESDLNKTENYKGFSLEFAENGTVVASNDTETIEGTWSEITDSGVKKLSMDFGEAVPFNEFNDDWELVEYNETRVELKDLSGGDGSINKLIFERN